MEDGYYWMFIDDEWEVVYFHRDEYFRPGSEMTLVQTASGAWEEGGCPRVVTEIRGPIEPPNTNSTAD